MNASKLAQIPIMVIRVEIHVKVVILSVLSVLIMRIILVQHVQHITLSSIIYNMAPKHALVFAQMANMKMPQLINAYLVTLIVLLAMNCQVTVHLATWNQEPLFSWMEISVFKIALMDNMKMCLLINA